MPITIKNSKGEVLLVYPADTLVGADLRHQNLEHAILAGMDCTGALFDHSVLVWAHCRKTIFIKASFKNADMLHIQAHESNCEEADWEGADIERGVFIKANLLNARNWYKLGRDYQAKFLGAVMPDGRKVEEE